MTAPPATIRTSRMSLSNPGLMSCPPCARSLPQPQTSPSSEYRRLHAECSGIMPALGCWREETHLRLGVPPSLQVGLDGAWMRAALPLHPVLIRTGNFDV